MRAQPRKKSPAAPPRQMPNLKQIGNAAPGFFPDNDEPPAARLAKYCWRPAKLAGIFIQNRAHRVCPSGLLERSSPHQHFIQNRAKGEDVGPMVGRLSTHLFG